MAGRTGGSPKLRFLNTTRLNMYLLFKANKNLSKGNIGKVALNFLWLGMPISTDVKSFPIPSSQIKEDHCTTVY